ncbi:MAG: alpha/beta fold hydrolase [Candidatus Saganbacteria bacterium]|nr:alpha/beta fold hydrolase [Candidatus Saganbacteria bacterium]
MHKSYPVIFVHGIGDSSFVWRVTGPEISKLYEKYYAPFKSGSGILISRFDKNPKHSIRNSCVYLTFNDHFSAPEGQVSELAEIISEVKTEAGADRVNLVCHSMGGLVARKYLAEHLTNHGVNKLVMIGTPNLGANLLRFHHLPTILIVAGIILTLILQNIFFLLITQLGLIVSLLAYIRGVNLLSGAAEAMTPDSRFLKVLNTRKLPANVEYVCLLSKAREFFHSLFGGDGAVQLESQQLSRKCVPNFEELNYKEILIGRSHFEEPQEADGIVKALGLYYMARPIKQHPDE